MPRSTWHQLRRIFLAISLSVIKAIKELVLDLLGSDGGRLKRFRKKTGTHTP